MGKKESCGTFRRTGGGLLIWAMLLGLLPAKVVAAGGTMELVSPDCAVTVSSEAADAGQNQGYKEQAVDGDTETQWSSGPMKTGGANADPAAEQTHQWLTVDLGEGRNYPVAIDSIKLWYNAKVWPMVYKIQTSPTGEENGPWTDLVAVSREPFDGAVKNGPGQNIADETNNATPSTAANTDTITKSSLPALTQDPAVESFVRFYVEKVNTKAGGR